MTSWRAFLVTVHVTALGLWAGTLGSAGAFAASVFPLMRGLDPRLPAFASYSGDHALIAGGTVAQRVFLITDIVQFVCALLAMGTLGALLAFGAIERRRPATIVRVCLMAVALACTAGSIIIVAPQLNEALKMHWAAARSGDMAGAMKHKEAVDSLHPIASRLMVGTLFCVLVSLVTGIWASVRPWRAADAQPAAASRYEEPALLRRKRA